ncbi:periplasmic binding protein/LacI transcriptional regulator [Candidatus Vecturithrix granuli]|uniref:Periplasmic binding protein/LacI transcriptional regulator n=1 Tax=Vecturithrix granuli TaxID=1499967 RepID=A0A0S6WCP0_VECG1|nr:periplasmic binding protein/LacI transcriptional regulator [Candidatus Vecturithrix granuli]
MKTKALGLFVVGLLIIGMVASSGIAAEKSYKIGAAVYGLKAEYMRLWTTALERHPAVVSGLANITVFDGNYDASVQQSQFETMVTQGFDAIIFVPIDIEAGAAAVELAASEGIPVIGSNTRVNSDKLTSYIGSDDVQSGAMEADAVLKKIGYKGNIVIIEGPIGQSAQIERRKGNLQVVEQYPDVKVLEMKTANWSRAEAMALMENWLSAHPGKIEGIIGQNDEMALGAIQALKAAGLDPKDFGIAGIDGVTDAMLAVKAGETVSILQDAKAQAQGALDLALRALIGDDYMPQADCWTQYADGMPWGDKLEPIYNVPWTPITLENVDALLEEREALTKR